MNSRSSSNLLTVRPAVRHDTGPATGTTRPSAPASAEGFFILGEGTMNEEAGSPVFVELGGATLRSLRAIAEREYGSADEVEAVILVILDHFAIGVARQDSWERELVQKIFGAEW